MTYQSEVLTDSPLVYYRLDDTSGTVMTDSSGAGRNGTYVNSPNLGATGLLTDDTNKAVDFDGGLDYADMASGSWIESPTITVEGWMKADSFLSPVMNIVSRDYGNSTNGRMWILRVLPSGKADWVFWTAADQNTVRQVTGATTLQTGMKYHIVGTYDGTTARLYVNGVLDASLSVSGALRTNAPGNPVARISREGGGQQQYFDGVLDEIAIYSAALPESRVVAHYSAGIAANLIASDDFDRANSSSLGITPVGGLTWEQVSGTWAISSNRAATTSGPASTICHAQVPTGAADVRVSVRAYDSMFVGAAGISVRGTDAANVGYVFEVQRAAGNPARLYKHVAGTYTQIAASAGNETWALGDTLTVECVGTSIVCKRNGTTLISTTDATYTTQTKHGIYTLAGSGQAGTVTLDGFSVTSLAPSAPAVTANLVGVGKFTARSLRGDMGPNLHPDPQYATPDSIYWSGFTRTTSLPPGLRPEYTTGAYIDSNLGSGGGYSGSTPDQISVAAGRAFIAGTWVKVVNDPGWTGHAEVDLIMWTDNTTYSDMVMIGEVTTVTEAEGWTWVERYYIPPDSTYLWPAIEVGAYNAVAGPAGGKTRVYTTGVEIRQAVNAVRPANLSGSGSFTATVKTVGASAVIASLTGSGVFTALVPTITHNNFADAKLLVIPTNGATITDGPFPNTLATTESGEPNVSQSNLRSVWYKVQPATSGNLKVSTVGSYPPGNPTGPADTQVGVYTGTALNNLTPLSPGANSSQDGGPSEGGNTYTTLLNFNVTAGTMYYIQVGAWSSAILNYVVKVTAPASVIPQLSGGFTGSGSFTAASAQGGAPGLTANLTGTGSFSATASQVLAPYPTAVLADSPLVYWRLGDTAGTTAVDATGNNRHGFYSNSPVLKAASLVYGDDDYSVDFNGVGNSGSTVSLGHAAWMNVTRFTAEAVIWLDAFADKPRTIVAHDDNGSNLAFRLFVSSQGYLVCYASSGGGLNTTVSTTTLAVGRAYHVAASFDGTAVRVYVNGVEEASTARVGNLDSKTAPLRVGALHNGSFTTEEFDGRIDEVAYYGTALSAARIAAHSAIAVPSIAVVSASLTGLGAFSATSVQVGVRTANLAGSGNFTASSVEVEVRTADLAGAGNFSATLAGVASSVTGNLVGTGTFSAASLMVGDSLAADLSGSGDFTASIELVIPSSLANLTGSGQFTSESTPVFVADVPEVLPEPEPYSQVGAALAINSDYGSDYVNITPEGVEAWVTFIAEDTTTIHFTFAGDPLSIDYSVVAYEGSPSGEAGSVSGNGQQSLAIDLIEGQTYWLKASSASQPFTLQLVWNTDPLIVEPSQDAESIRAEVYEPDGVTLITELPKRFGVNLQEALNVSGSGSLSVRIGDETLSMYPGLLGFGNIVKFWLGIKCIHGFRIARRRSTWVTTDEWAGLVRTVEGPSVQFLLEDFMVRHASEKLVDRALDSRAFTWVAPRGEWYNAEDWNGPYNSSSQAEPPSDFEKPFKDRAKYGNPKKWPDPQAQWMWVHVDSDRNEGNFDPPPLKNTRYFRKQFSTAERQVVKIFASADEKFEVYLDGEEVLSGDGVETGYTEMQKRKLMLPSGTHTLAIRQSSLNQTKADGADAVLFTMMKLDTKGRPTSNIIRSNDSWETTYLRPVPAWNRAQVLRAVVKEAQARGNNSALALTLDFTKDRDSRNQRWLDKFNEEVSIGTSGLALQALLSENGNFDVWVDPLDLKIKAWRRRGRDKSASITLEPGRNLISWEVEEVEEVKNNFLIQYDGGWTEWKAGPSAQQHGSREAYLTMGHAKDDETAQRIIRKASRGLAWAEKRAGTSDIVKRTQATPTGGLIAVPGARPFLDFGVGDTVKAPNDQGILVPHRVLAITLTEDELGEISYDPELEEVR